MINVEQEMRLRKRVAFAVLAAWGVCLLLYALVAARIEAGGTGGIAGLLATATRGGVITPADAWASGARRVAWAIALVSLPYAFPTAWRTRGVLAARVVGESTPETVAFLRIAVAAILLAITFVDDLPSVALLPASAARPKGIMLWIHAIPGLGGALRSAPLLTALVWCVRGLLTLALLGWGGRRVVFAAALGALLFGGLLRSYANAFHAGLLPIWLLFVLACYRCTDAWSLDSRRAQHDPEVDQDRRAHYGWARYTFFSVLALAYFAAGMSKLFNGGPLWWEPDNLRVILAMDALNPMELPFRVGLPVATGADWPLALLGLSAIAIELGMLLMLFSRVARWVMPAAMLATHVGIAVLQNVLFADLILLLGLYYAQRVTDRLSPCFSTYLRGLRPTPGEAEAAQRLRPATLRDAKPFVVFATVFAAANLAGIEFFPLTGMQMYSRRNHDGVVRYHRIVTVDELGDQREAYPQEWVRALRDSRYRFHLHRCFDDSEAARGACLDFLHGFAQHLSTTVEETTASPPVALEAQEWRWPIRERLSSPSHGALHARVRVPLVARD